MPLIVIVSGPPCTGKSTLGERLARDLRLPFLSKDRIKELLFDTLGTGDRAWSQKLGAASMEMLFMLADTELAAGRSCVLEANFRPAQANAQFHSLKEKYTFQAIQIDYIADTDVLLARFQARASSGMRHAGHLDSTIYPELVADLQRAVYGPLEVADAIYTVNTTDFEKVDFERLLVEIRDCLINTSSE